MRRPGVFLDRDGVINFNRPDYVKSWTEFRFLPGVLPALCRLARIDCAIVVVSNQSAIGRGLVSGRRIGEIHERMMEAVAAGGGRLDLVLCCPHAPWEGCACRKPRPGMLFHAADLLDLSLADSFLVGDAASDILAAQAAGCHPILVKTGRGRSQARILQRRRIDGFDVVDDLQGAVDFIVGAVSRAEESQIEGSR